MLAYILALAVGLGSLALYLGAFLVPELHRKNDFIWSGVGLFYALVLWVCAQRITRRRFTGASRQCSIVRLVCLAGSLITTTTTTHRATFPGFEH